MRRYKDDGHIFVRKSEQNGKELSYENLNNNLE